MKIYLNYWLALVSLIAVFNAATNAQKVKLPKDRDIRKMYIGTAGENKTCKSSLRGATYATSKTELSSDQWVNLDQGFDDTGAHKWDPPPGTVGHIFLRRNK